MATETTGGGGRDGADTGRVMRGVGVGATGVPTLGYGPSVMHFKGNKLKGVENYHIWRLLMDSYIKRHGLAAYTAARSSDEEQHLLFPIRPNC